MHWVEKYAPLFGGDAHKYFLPQLHVSFASITVMGESAGASSIMHHLTAKSGNITLPFHKAIIQSPAFFPQYLPYLDLINNVDMIPEHSINSIEGLQRAQVVLAKGPLNVCKDDHRMFYDAQINVRLNGQGGASLILDLLLTGLM